MRIKFMGNGIRILHVAQSLCSDCTMRIYHCRSEVSMYCDGLADVVNFILEHGFRGIYYLEFIEVGDL